MFTIFKDFLDLQDGTKLLCAFIVCSASYVVIQGNPNQNCPFLRAITLKLCISNPMLVKPICV